MSASRWVYVAKLPFPLGFHECPCTSARGAQLGPTGALLDLSSTNISCLERYKRLVSLHSAWSIFLASI